MKECGCGSELPLIPNFGFTFKLLSLYPGDRTHSMKMAAFRDVAICCLIEVELRFIGAYCLHHQGDFAIFTLAAVRT
jgi:hypothetical protein